MGVFGRKRKNGSTVYYVTFLHGGRQVQERSGTDRRAAGALERQRKREVAEGTYSAQHRSGAVTFERFAETWLSNRTNVAASDDARHIRTYAVEFFRDARLSDIARADAYRFALALRDTQKRKTAKNIWGTTRTLFRDAHLQGLIATDPCALPRGFWGRAVSVPRAPYSALEARTLTEHPDVRPDFRVWLALALYTGMREGEVCGRRFRDWDPEGAPLGAITVASQYRDEPLKTKRPRRVPVHPALHRVLVAWRDGGFELVFGRPPTADDWIVPRRGRIDLPHTRSSAYKAFQTACELAAVTPHSLHSTRHTFITWARRGGARADVLEVVTHNAAGKIIDQYTHWDWAPLCEAVSCLDYGAETSGANVTAVPAEAPGASPGIPVRATDSAPVPMPFYDAGYDAETETAENMLFGGGGAGNRTRVREASDRPSFTCVVAVSPATEFADSAAT